MNSFTSKNNLFLWVLGALVVFGLVMLSTASAVLAYRQTGDSFFYLKNQMIRGVLPGLFLFFLVSRVPYKKLKHIALPFLLLSVLLLFLLFYPAFGVSVNTATRWLQIGSFSFQPSEVLKLSFIIYLAALFASKKKSIMSVQDGLLPFVVLSGLVATLLISQPDLGTLGVILFIALAMYFVAGARISHIAILVVCILTLVVSFIYFTGYEMDRIITFLNPEHNALGSSYQISRSRLAIGSGGLFGLGFGSSQEVSSVRLPEPMGDSIFAIIALEFGFVGISFVVALFMAFAWYGISIARQCFDSFGKLLVVGIVSWVLIQSFINISGISGLLPLTGLPLPFMSYGGTSMVVLLTACGIVYNIQRSH